MTKPSIAWLRAELVDAIAGLPESDVGAEIRQLVLDLLDITNQTEATEAALIEAFTDNPKAPTAALHAELATLREKVAKADAIARDLALIARRLDTEGRQRDRIDILAAALTP